jgi:hypothetical protein
MRSNDSGFGMSNRGTTEENMSMRDLTLEGRRWGWRSTGWQYK